MAYAPRSGGFGGGSRGGARGGFGGGSKFGAGAPRGRGGFGGDRGGFGDKPELFPAICADCGTRCEVPFKPNGRKPVLCRSCFATENGGEQKFGGNDRPERAPRPQAAGMDEATAAQFRSIQGKLDMIIKALNANDLAL